MDFKTLKIFRAVVQQGSISKAAVSLNYVQSNVSARIQQLEERLGSVLLVRESRGIKLTAAGETLISYADRILNLREEALEAVAAATQGKGLLRLGAMESTLAVRLAGVLSQFTMENPEINLELKTGTTDMLLEDVINYRLDGAIVGGEINSKMIRSEQVFSEEIVLVTSKKIQSLEACEFRKLIVFRQGCAYRSFGEQWLREKGMSPVQLTELGTLDGIFACIAANLGVTFLPVSIAEQHGMYDYVNVHELNCERAKVSINLITNAELQVHPALSLMLDLMK